MAQKCLLFSEYCICLKKKPQTLSVFSSSTEAQTWCETTVCPSKETANEANCCIHHFNIHSCPANEDGMTNNLCGPWIPASGTIYTHSQAVVGSPSRGNWSSTVSGLFLAGEHSVIAHFKIAGMHLALVKKVKVHPKSGKLSMS